jgi:hypothetical protein
MAGVATKWQSFRHHQTCALCSCHQSYLGTAETTEVTSEHLPKTITIVRMPQAGAKATACTQHVGSNIYARTGCSTTSLSHWYVGFPAARRMGTTTNGMATATPANRADSIIAGSPFKAFRNHPMVVVWLCLVPRVCTCFRRFSRSKRSVQRRLYWDAQPQRQVVFPKRI